MKRLIQSIFYVIFILTMFWLLLKVGKVYENPFSIYENPLVVILAVLLCGTVLLKECAFYVSQKVTKDLRNEISNDSMGILNIFVYSLFVIVSFGVIIKANSAYKNPFNIYENPLVVLLAGALIGVILFKEYAYYLSYKTVKALQVEKLGLDPEEEEFPVFKRIIKKLTRSRAIEENNEIILDHNYDGIQELDNVLPPWWVYLFYGTIIFAAVYLVNFEILGGDSQKVEYEKSMTAAKLAIEKYKAETPNAFDIEKAELLTDEKALNRGKAIFNLNCAACHAPDGGGGIGPNLTDKNWILGGGFKNVVNTLLNGGREGKGMISWKSTLKPQDIQKVASYVMSLQGSTPAKPKAPQGEIWKEESK